MSDSDDEVARGAAALLVVPEWHSQRLSRDLDARAAEAKGLALAIGLDVVAVHPLRLRQTRAATLLGVGQIDAIKPDIESKGVQLVVVDAALSAIQQRNLETAFGTKVIDTVVTGASELALPATLTPGTTYYWRVNAQNGAGTSPWSAAWSFTVPQSPPTITGQSPANGATGVPVGENVTVTFSRAMKASSITAQTFFLTRADGSPVAAAAPSTSEWTCSRWA